MKKVMMIAAVVAALTSCQSKNGQTQAVVTDEETVTLTAPDSSSETVALYEGILPAADGPGIKYSLSLDKADPASECRFVLVTTYLDANGPGQHKSHTIRGVKRLFRSGADNGSKQAYKLVPDSDESPLYFVVVDDSTLRLVNDSLEESASGLNYDIVLVK